MSMTSKTISFTMALVLIIGTMNLAQGDCASSLDFFHRSMIAHSTQLYIRNRYIVD